MANKTHVDDNTIQWYIMTYPESHRKVPNNLPLIKRQREDCGDTDFDFISPTYKDMKFVRGKWVETNRPLLFNYVFIRSSVNTIFKIKQYLPTYNFLPSRLTEDGNRQFPALTDKAMRDLQWIMKSYDKTLPVYIPKHNELMEGDKVRILEGRAFEGMTATVMSASSNSIMVSIDDLFYIPLLNINEGDYVITELNTEGKHKYGHLNNQHQLNRLYDALCEKHHKGTVTEAAKELANTVLKQCAYIENINTNILRTKQYAYLLPAYKLLDDTAKFNEVSNIMTSLVDTVKAEMSLAILYLTLYVCTDSSVWYTKSHELITPWLKEKNLKKQKLSLIATLNKFDETFCHI